MLFLFVVVMLVLALVHFTSLFGVSVSVWPVNLAIIVSLTLCFVSISDRSYVFRLYDLHSTSKMFCGRKPSLFSTMSASEDTDDAFSADLDRSDVV